MLTLSFVLAAVLPLALTTTWNLQDEYIGSGFYSGFSFQAISDPTHGRVQYVSKSAAQSAGLVSTSSDSFIMRVDNTTTLSASAAGRKSIRLQSNKSYTHHALIADIRHLPSGCGTWPALWTVGSDWPNNGEVDIIEGVHGITPNLMSLHTSAGCTQGYTVEEMKGAVVSKDCNADANSNQGCGVRGASSRDFGSPFNNAGGGWFAMERTSTRIRIWFWSRQDSSVPSAVKNGDSTIYTDSFGTATAVFANSSSCNLEQHFAVHLRQGVIVAPRVVALPTYAFIAHHVIINTSLCGDWAGSSSAWAASGCSSTGSCVDYVNQNSGAFWTAYWDFAALRMYT
ncbi:family 16 hypothetical endo-1,3(4)-beta-glucanase from glycoside hydrolase [Auriculariales sp. MPI-PUGE-AT-0066]|nr:family 16 hypothetical endo-1,3(4)-beta-glucanase from glycoside hydrolase [Auriculariales sp. MPI-PUGE-AT-0066]